MVDVLLTVIMSAVVVKLDWRMLTLRAKMALGLELSAASALGLVGYIISALRDNNKN
jgi:hypothetical protein